MLQGSFGLQINEGVNEKLNLKVFPYSGYQSTGLHQRAAIDKISLRQILKTIT